MSTVKHRKSPLPVVAIVGRPNVGKSTFFNRMVGGRRALTHNRPGVTRDRHYGETEYDGVRFVLIDTGGFEPDVEKSDVFVQVRNQALLAIDEADVILFFMDGRQGLASGDYEIVHLLRTYQKPTLHVVNKIDHVNQDDNVYEFYGLGVDELFPISSEHSRGVETMLDAMIASIPTRHPAELAEAEAEAEGEEEGDFEDLELDDGGRLEVEGAETPEELGAVVDDEGEGDTQILGVDPEDDVSDLARTVVRRRRTNPDLLRIALVGRPNVGKSSLANAMLQSDRQVVHPVAGTTRDSIDLPFEFDGKEYVLVDTAGVRKRARITDKLEQYTVIKAFKAISSADVALLLVDAVEGVTSQEKRLAGMIEEKGRAVAVLVNKWDLMEKKGITRREYAEKLLRELDHIRYAPVHFLSAMTGDGVDDILPLVERIGVEHGKEVPTAEFNRFLEEITTAHSPPIHKGHPVRLYYGTQVNTRPPTFLIYTNNTEGIRTDYRRYIENCMRDRYGFIGSPVHLVVRGRKR